MWHEETRRDGTTVRYQRCNRCPSSDCEERYSCGAYYSVLCDACWDASGVRRDLDTLGGASEDEIEAADYRYES